MNGGNISFTVVIAAIVNWLQSPVTKYTERKKKRRVNFIPKFHSSLKKFVKYFTMITKRYMYGTKVPNFIGLWSTSLDLLKFTGSYPPPPPPQILKSKSNWKSISDNTESQNFVQNKHVSTFSTRFPHTIWYTSTIHNALRFFYRFFVKPQHKQKPFPLFHLLSFLYFFSLSLGDDTKWPTRVGVSLSPNSINQSINHDVKIIIIIKIINKKSILLPIFRKTSTQTKTFPSLSSSFFFIFFLPFSGRRHKMTH